MENAIEKKPEISKDIQEKLLFTGDISKLSQEQKMQYYLAMCSRLDLDPATLPFQVIRFPSQNKEVLYCTKAGAEQLNKKHKISHEIIEKKLEGDLYIVSVRAQMDSENDTRFTDEVGIVDVTGKKGNELGNLMLKSVTKAKRRATLSLLGLGMLDETEAQDVPGSQVVDIHVGGSENKCSECQRDLTAGVVKFSTDRYGKALCIQCQGNNKPIVKEAKFTAPELKQANEQYSIEEVV